jgi:hypothetical protein
VSPLDRQRRQRVGAVIKAGRRLADPGDRLGQEARSRLPATTGLTPPGVELALVHHLETAPQEEHLAALLAACGTATACHVLLAANVCTAPLRALACAVATAPTVALRPSRRDPVLAELLVQALAESSDFTGQVDLVDPLSPAAGEELHLYGSDESLAAIVPTVPAGTRVRAHGSGLGIALIEGKGTVTEAAGRLADDVIVFDGQGCLTPRFALVVGDAARAERYGLALTERLAERGSAIPRGVLSATDRADLTRYRNLVESLGQVVEGPHHAIGIDPQPTGLVLPPALRCVHVVPVSSETVAALLSPWAQLVTAIGLAEPGPVARQIMTQCPAARLSPLGMMQKPPLDGPVDLRTTVATTG